MRKPFLLLSCLVVAVVGWRQAAAVDPPTSNPVSEGGRYSVATQAAPAAKAVPPMPGLHVEVPPPPFTDGIFPCTGCHDNTTLVANRSRRELTDMHADIVLKHDKEHRWCLDCHDADRRDQLHLASGEAVQFQESYKLCGQCHGEKYRDWRAGVHGRRVGQWNGSKKYLLCVHCHSPHEPRFKAIAPKPAPFRATRPRT